MRLKKTPWRKRRKKVTMNSMTIQKVHLNNQPANHDQPAPRSRESHLPLVQNRHMQYDAPARPEPPIPPSQNGRLQYNAHAATTVFPQF